MGGDGQSEQRHEAPTTPDTGNTAQADCGNQADDQSNEASVTSRQPSDIFKPLRLCLIVTLLVDGIGALALACGNVVIAPSLLGTLGSIVLLAIAAANVWALNAAIRRGDSWARDSVIAQIFVFLAALYFLWRERGSLIKLNWQTVAVNWMNWTHLGAPAAKIAILIGVIAAGWILFLWRRADVKWTRTAVIVAAVVPLAGFLQFWLQNFYIPQSQMPQMDLSVDLSEQGRTGSIIHLTAKVTVHNRGPVPVDIAGTLMRVTAYVGRPHQPIDQSWCDSECQSALRLSGPIYSDYRVDPMRAESGQAIFADYFTKDPDGFLTPGETDTYQKEIDLPPDLNFARLSASAVFYNDRRLKSERACEAYRPDYDSMSDPIPSQANGHFYCVEYEFAPANIIDWLLAERPVLRMWVITDAENPAREYPRINWLDGTAYDPRNDDPASISDQFSEKYPTDSDTDVSAEYARTDVTPSSGGK